MASAYATGGWLAQRRGRRQDEIYDRADLPNEDDTLAAVFARLTDVADLVRCATTCRRWCRIIAKEAAVLSRILPPELILGSRAMLGLFHQEDAGVTAPRKRKRSSSSLSSPAAGQPCFVPTAAAVQLIRGAAASAIDVGDLFEYSRPVASRNGLVVLELPRDRHADGLKLCVFNPMTGHVALFPPLSGNDKPGSYACALLTSDDDDDKDKPLIFVFRVLVVYNRGRITAFRAYSSDTGRWGREVARSLGPKIDDRRMRALGQAAVLHGVAYWPLRRSAIAIRLDGESSPREVTMPPNGIPGGDEPQRFRLMGVTASQPANDADDGHGKTKQHLCFITAGFRVNRDLMKAGQPFRRIVLLTSALVPDGSGGSRWENPPGHGIVVPELKVRAWDALNLRWFCERTGVVLFTVGADSNSPGAYAMNLATRKLEKLADDNACHSWRNVVGYEMDAPACLASIACY